MLLAFLSVFRRYPLVKVQLDIAGRSVRYATPLVFIGNNQYQTDLLNLGRRIALDDGELSVYLVKAPNRLRLLRLVFRGLLGRLAMEKDFELHLMKSLTVESPKRRLRMAMDGEVLRWHPPLAFQIRPRSLRVLGP
jgi:diacylglycerol kinase family enzyme